MIRSINHCETRSGAIGGIMGRTEVATSGTAHIVKTGRLTPVFNSNF